MSSSKLTNCSLEANSSLSDLVRSCLLGVLRAVCSIVFSRLVSVTSGTLARGLMLLCTTLEFTQLDFTGALNDLKQQYNIISDKISHHDNDITVSKLVGWHNEILLQHYIWPSYYIILHNSTKSWMPYYSYNIQWNTRVIKCEWTHYWPFIEFS